MLCYAITRHKNLPFKDMLYTFVYSVSSINYFICNVLLLLYFCSLYFWSQQGLYKQNSSMFWPFGQYLKIVSR